MNELYDLIGFHCVNIILQKNLLYQLKFLKDIVKSQFVCVLFRFRFFLVSRLYTFFRFSFDVLAWKGIWGLWDFIIGSGW